MKLPFANVKRLAVAAQQPDANEQELQPADEVYTTISHFSGCMGVLLLMPAEVVCYCDAVKDKKGLPCHAVDETVIQV